MVDTLKADVRADDRLCKSQGDEGADEAEDMDPDPRDEMDAERPTGLDCSAAGGTRSTWPCPSNFRPRRASWKSSGSPWSRKDRAYRAS